MVMWYKKGASHYGVLKERELNSRVSAIAKCKKIATNE